MEPLPTVNPVSFAAQVSSNVDFAFQPIVNMRTGRYYGFEALLRGHDRLGFDTISAMFDHAYATGSLHRVDVILREKAIEKFARLNNGNGFKLFFNLDNRILDAADYQPGQTDAILARHALSPSSICFEISEQHGITLGGNAERVLDAYRDQTSLIAIDDFGTGHSGLKLLYEYHPDFIKIDRFFINGVAVDSKKKFLISAILGLAHTLGVQVIAEGIETEKEFLTCRNLGCDLAQGYLISKPTLDTDAFTHVEGPAQSIAALVRNDRRESKSDQRIIYEQFETIKPLHADMLMDDVFDAFRRNKQRSFFPVVDDRNEPLGLVRENELKEYVYSPFGKDLIANPSVGKTLRSFISPCPVADIYSEAEKIVETYTLNNSCEGIIIVQNGAYVGFLSAASLLRVINEKNLAQAQDQNPLTKLPGNTSISDYISASLNGPEEALTLVYFDFDNFKPFNDTYGFRQGDRALLLFADLMRKQLTDRSTFIGHIGGDDFFAGFKDEPVASVIEKIGRLRETFRSQVESFYSQDARESGFIIARGRGGKARKYPLLTVSAAVVEAPPTSTCPDNCSADNLAALIAELKTKAKDSKNGISTATMIRECGNSP